MRSTKRGEELYANVPHAVQATYVPVVNRVLVLLSDGFEISLRQKDYRWMEAASLSELSEIELEADGFGVYFPKLDEGFWIPTLLGEMLCVWRFLAEAAVRDQARLTASATAA